MQMLGALLLIAMGAGALAVGWQGYRVGELPAGSNFMRPFRPNRDDNPFAFRFYLALYCCGGTALAVWGLLALAGMAPPLRFR